MRDMDATWKQLAADGEFTMKTKAVINGVEYDTITAPVITHGLLQDKTLTVGNCIAGTLKFTVMTADEIPKSAKVVIKSCLSDGTTDSNWHEMGTFWIDKRTVNSELEDYDLIDLECYDAMLKGNQAYSDDSEGLNWPKPMLDVVTRIAQQMGVEIDERTQIKTGDDYVVTLPSADETLLDILGHIGALHGGNWTITPENELRLVPIVFQQGGTYNVIDENENNITGNSDRLVWKHKSSDDSVNNAGGGLLNVPVVTGEINTFGQNNEGTHTETDDRVLGEYRIVSGRFYAYENLFSTRTGHGADTTDQTTYNAYAPNGQVVICRYSAFFNVPRNSTITRVYCDINGHAESTEKDDEYMCVQLVSGSTVLSEKINFKDVGITNTTIRLECTSIPTHGQLESMELECTVGYYGGAINGATFYVVYDVPNAQYLSRVTITVDSETSYTSGEDGGVELRIENNPYGTQRICDALLAEFGGAEYVPFEITRAIYDPAAELGDWIVVGNRVTSVLYVETQTLDIGFIADASAPGEDELESEYPYTTALQRVQYTVQGLTKDNEIVKSEIRQTQYEISLRVTAGQVESIIEQNADSIRLKADRISWQSTYSSMTEDGKLTCTGATINDGDIYVEQIHGESFVSWLRVSGGIITGGDTRGYQRGRITFEQTADNNNGGITLEGNGYVYIDAPNLYVRGASADVYNTGQSVTFGPLTFTKGILTANSGAGKSTTVGPLTFTNGILTTNSGTGYTGTITNVVTNLSGNSRNGYTWQNYTLAFQNGICV